MDLASLDALYAQTETKPKGEFEHLPDGRYQVAVHMVDMKETSTKKPMLSWQLKVLAGPHAGRMLFKNSVIDANTLSFLKQDLTAVGWDKPLSALGDPLARQGLLDVKLDVTQKTKAGTDPARPNVNVYFNRRLDAVSAPAGAADYGEAPF